MDNSHPEAKYAFISHRNTEVDLNVATKLYDFFVEQRVDCWIDKKHLVSSEWREQINNRIQNCSVFIIIVSKDSLASQEVKNEIHTVRDMYDRHVDVTIFPVAIDNSLFDNNDSDPVFLRQFQGEVINDLSDLDTSFKKLFARLSGKLGIAKNNRNDFELSPNMEELIKYKGEDSIVFIDNCVKTIRRDAFSGNDHLEKVVIPESVTTIEKYAFNRCPNLKDVDGMLKVQDIGKDAFFNTPLMDNDMVIVNGVLLSYKTDEPIIKIPGGVRVIANKCFELSNIEEVILPEGLEYIGSKAFADCYNLKKINIPSSVIGIGGKAFDCDDKLKEIVCDEKYKQLFEGRF